MLTIDAQITFPVALVSLLCVSHYQDVAPPQFWMPHLSRFRHGQCELGFLPLEGKAGSVIGDFIASTPKDGLRGTSQLVLGPHGRASPCGPWPARGAD